MIFVTAIKKKNQQTKTQCLENFSEDDRSTAGLQSPSREKPFPTCCGEAEPVVPVRGLGVSKSYWSQPRPVWGWAERSRERLSILKAAKLPTCEFSFLQRQLLTIFFPPPLFFFFPLPQSAGSRLSANPLPHQPLLPAWMSLELFPSHLGLTSGLTRPVSPHISSRLFQPLLTRKAKENPKPSQCLAASPAGEREKGIILRSSVENPSSAWPGEVRILQIGKLGETLARR